MSLGHEKLDVYRLSIGCAAWVYEKAAGFYGVQRPARNQWLRASQSIPLNLAEGNGKAADRRRYFEIGCGSALECAAIQDVLVVVKVLDREESRQRKTELDRMAAMLSRLGGEGREREDTTFETSMTPMEPISIPIAISMWRDTTSSPNQALQATLDSAPERRRPIVEEVSHGDG